MNNIVEITGSRIVMNPVITDYATIMRNQALDMTIDLERRIVNIIGGTR